MPGRFEKDLWVAEADELIARGLETREHMERIGAYSALLARAAGLDRDRCDRIGSAAPLHDVGKVAIADEILLKRGELTVAERAEMERHAEAGHEILAGSDAPTPRLAAEIALTHHERFDGSGYPKKLSGTEIPIAGRVVAIADVFDAMICDRPQRGAFTLEETVREMLRGRGTAFDPDLIDHFLAELDAMLAAAARTSDLDLTMTL